MYKCIYLSLLIIFFTVKNVLSYEAVPIDDQLTEKKVTSHIEYFVDHTSRLTIDDMVKNDRIWQENEKDNFTFGYVQNPHWFKIRIINNGKNLKKIFLEVDGTFLDYIDLYIPLGNGKYEHQQVGIRVPFEKRKVKYRNYMFLLQDKDKTIDCYIKIVTFGPLEFSFNLLTPEELYNRISIEYPILWLYYGFMIIMVFYNLFIFISIKDKSYLYYIIFLSSFIFTQLIFNNFSSQYLWSHVQFWNEFTIFMGAAVFGLLMFFRFYVQTKKYNTQIDQILFILSVINLFFSFIVIIISKFFLNFAIYQTTLQLITLISFISFFLLLLFSIFFAQKKIRQAKFFVISFSFLILGVLLRELVVFGIMPFTFITKYSLQLGSVFTIVLLSLGLSDKINVLTNDLKSLNENLEKKVDERTMDLEDANSKLVELDRIKTNFFANISHEIRTPLTLILSPVETVIQNNYMNEAGNDFYDNIQRNAIRLLRLVNNILDLSKIEENKMGMSIREVDIVRVLENYMSNVRLSAESKKIKLTFKSCTDSLILYLDIAKFDKIGMNLFSNALKFTDNGGNIDIIISEDDERGYIEVNDTGLGIPTNMLEAIFDRFSQVDTSSTRKYEGTGIGLSLAKELVEMHGGSISVQSKYIEDFPNDHGTSFKVSFLKGKDHFENVAGVDFFNVKDQAESVPKSNKRRFFGMREMIEFQELDLKIPENEEKSKDNKIFEKKLIVVEDNPEMRSFLISLLNKHYNVYFAIDGLDGLDKIKDLKPDIIVTDVMMPRMDGIQMTKALKEDASLNRIPVLMLSARTEIENKIEGFQYGADDYLTKPFNERELLIRVKSLLDNREYENIISQRNYEIEQELETARLLQQKLLPDSLPEIPGFKCNVIYIPMDKVGGDFYSINFNESNNSIELFIADVSGHGLPGAFLSMVTSMALESLQNESSPAKILKKLNNVICRSTVNSNFVTAFYGAIDIESKVFKFSNTGHIPPLIFRPKNNDFYELNTKGPALGLFCSIENSEEEIQLESGDRILLYTDGIIESRNEDNVEFTDDGLKDFTRQNIELSPGEFSDKLLKFLKDYSGSEKFDDDSCLLVMDVI